MGVVDDAVEDGVGQGRIADQVVPSVDRDLAGDQRGAAAVTLLDDLQEIAPLFRRRAVPGPSRPGSAASRRRGHASAWRKRPSPRASARSANRRGTRW